MPCSIGSKIMELVKYRDAGLPTYTYFWVDQKNRVAGPYFNSQQEAEDWLAQNTSSKEIVVTPSK